MRKTVQCCAHAQSFGAYSNYVFSPPASTCYHLIGWAVLCFGAGGKTAFKSKLPPQILSFFALVCWPTAVMLREIPVTGNTHTSLVAKKLRASICRWWPRNLWEKTVYNCCAMLKLLDLSPTWYSDRRVGPTMFLEPHLVLWPESWTHSPATMFLFHMGTTELVTVSWKLLTVFRTPSRPPTHHESCWHDHVYKPASCCTVPYQPQLLKGQCIFRTQVNSTTLLTWPATAQRSYWMRANVSHMSTSSVSSGEDATVINLSTPPPLLLLLRYSTQETLKEQDTSTTWMPTTSQGAAQDL